jgi:hypothetical protein
MAGNSDMVVVITVVEKFQVEEIYKLELEFKEDVDVTVEADPGRDAEIEDRVELAVYSELKVDAEQPSKRQLHGVPAGKQRLPFITQYSQFLEHTADISPDRIFAPPVPIFTSVLLFTKDVESSTLCKELR